MIVRYFLKISTIFIIFLLSNFHSVALAKSTDKIIFISTFERNVSQTPNMATRKILSESNIAFTIPYIQTSTDIPASLIVQPGSNIKKVKIVLSKNGQVITSTTVTAPYKTIFHDVKKGEYALDAYALDDQENIRNNEKFHDQVTNIGIGDIIIAIGDSTTEGYFMYKSQFPNWLTAPSDYTSADMRTYPQPGGKATFPTRTWLPALSSELEKIYGYPVFIKNAGYSHFTSADYLSIMQTTPWDMRQQSLRPNKWMIMLGVNDGILKVSQDTYKQNLKTIITILKNKYHAQPHNIMLAKPTYAIGVDNVKNLLPAIDSLQQSESVAQGPDFWTFFSTRFYPTFNYYKDQYHQTPLGTKEMVKLWTLAYVDQENLPVRASFYLSMYSQEFITKIMTKLEKIKKQIL